MDSDDVDQGLNTDRKSYEYLWLKVVGAFLWIGATGFAAFLVTIGAMLSGGGLLGELPNLEDQRASAPFFLFAGLIAAAGPLGIWLFNRHWAWLALSSIPVALGLAAAISLWV